MSTFSPSPQQSAYFDALLSTSSNLMLDAKAGCGKTTTLVEGLKLLPLRRTGELLPLSCVFLAFNKSIADTLSSRCPSHVECSTFHSLGFRALKQILPLGRDAIDRGQKKWKTLLWDTFPKDHPDSAAAARLLSLVRSSWPTPETAGAVERLAEYMDIPIDDDTTAKKVLLILERGNRDMTCCDFDDMLYQPVRLGASFRARDYVFVDEAQDTNGIQVEILRRLGGATTRYIFVGDPAQAIYGFRGAGTDSMSTLAQEFQCNVMPLSVTYRCPKAVVTEALPWLQAEKTLKLTGNMIAVDLDDDLTEQEAGWETDLPVETNDEIPF